MRPRRAATCAALSLLTALAVLVSGCSSDGGSGQGDGATSTTSSAVTSSSEAPPDHTDAAPVGEAATGAPVPSAGCEGDARTDVVNTFHHELDVDGESRWYLLTTPPHPGDGRPVPLVVDLHGLMEGAEIHALMTRTGEQGQREGFITAFPQGSGQPVRWDTRPGEGNADLAMLDAMIDQIGEERCVDLSRVYAEGLSYGAIMTSLLACERADRFAAVAAVDGLTISTPCDPPRTVPVLAFHGTQDPILGFNGQGGDLGRLVGNGTAAPSSTEAPQLDGPGYPANVAAWAARNGCDDTPTDTEVSAEVVHRVYDCPEGADVEFYIVVGGGHSWPGSQFSRSISGVVGYTTSDVDASVAIWEFFRRFRLPG